MTGKWSMAVVVSLTVGGSLLAHAAAATQDWQPAVVGADGRRAFDDLAKFYADEKSIPSYVQALADLKAQDETVRTQAGNYLLALLKQSLADEDNGRVAWQSTPFWGGGAESAARSVRGRVAESFGKNAGDTSAVPAALWLTQVDRAPKNQAAGIEALRRITGPAATAAFRALLSEPAQSKSALVGALEEVGKRRLNDLGPQVLALGNSYRSEVRNAAREAARTLGLGPLPEYEAAKAFTPRLEKQLHDIATMILARIPAGAKWSDVTYSPSRSEGPKTVSGWVVKRTSNEILLVDWFADEISVPALGSKVKESSLVAAAKVIGELRKTMSDKMDNILRVSQLSRKGMFTAQFEPGLISLPEIVVGTVAFEHGDRALAAAVLFPRIEDMADDRWLTEISRDLLGHQYHQQMLNQFSQERDYTRVLDLARHLSQPVFDGYQYQDRAREMAEQIVRRSNDFRTLTLPTPAEWKQLQPTLPRADQIRFLADRLRLLNCFQDGQPGDVSYTDPQYSAPTGGSNKRVEVINPYKELQMMKMEVADIPALLPYVADDDFMLTFSYWRDFHPSRTLHRVSWAAAEIVNAVAKRNLVDLRELSGESRDMQMRLDKISTWVEANRDISSTDRLLDALATVSDVRELQNAAGELVAQRNMKVLPLLKLRLRDFPRYAADIVKLAYDIDSAEAVPYAREWIEDSDGNTKFWAGLILLRHGDRASLEGLAEVKGALQKDDGEYLYPHAIEDLLALKSPVATDVACGILPKPGFARSFDRSRVLRQLMLAGQQDALDYILKQLDSSELYGTAFLTIGGKQVKREQVVGDHMADEVADWRTDGWVYDSMATADARAAKRKELARWLRGQFARIQKGEASDIPLPEPLKRTQQRIDAP